MWCGFHRCGTCSSGCTLSFVWTPDDRCQVVCVFVLWLWCTGRISWPIAPLCKNFTQVCRTPLSQSPAANLVLCRWQWYSCHWEGRSRFLERFGLYITTWVSAHYWLVSYNFWNGNEHHYLDHLGVIWKTFDCACIRQTIQFVKCMSKVY